MAEVVRTIPRQKDWYRQFWPWFLIFLPGSVVVASIITIVIATQGADSLVDDDYYKRAMLINRDLSKIEYARKIGLTGGLHIKDNSLQIDVRAMKNTINLAPTLSVKFIHPVHAAKDFTVTLLQKQDEPKSLSANGVSGHYISQQSRKIKLLSQGAWYIRLQPLDNNWQLKGKIKNSQKTVPLYAE